MNISFPDTANIGKRRLRAILLFIAACALSIFYVFTENVYTTHTSLYTYNPITLYILIFSSSSVFLSSAITVLTYQNKKITVILAVIASVVISGASIALGASPMQLLLALACIPSGTIISMCISSGFEKAHTVVGNSVIIAIVLVFASTIYIYSSFGEVSRRSIAYIVNVFREAFVSFYGQYSLQTGLSGIDISATFDMFIVILPSFFCVLVSVISYIVTTVSRALILGQGAQSEKIARWPLKMSRLASVVFITSLIFAMLSFSGTNEYLILTMYNVMIILTPGFFLIGIRTSFMHFRRPSFFSIIFGIFMLISCFSNPILLILLIASMGAFDNLFPSVRAILYGEQTRKL